MKFWYNHRMEDLKVIIPPAGEDDTEGAQRVFEEFLTLYQPVLMRVEYYLEEVIEHAGVTYAEAYKPWQSALHDLFKGVYLTAKAVPLPDTEKFIDALRTFSFDSAIRFLSDICTSCRLKLPQDWVTKFREHINLLLFSLAILTRAQQPSLAR